MWRANGLKTRESYHEESSAGLVEVQVCPRGYAEALRARKEEIIQAWQVKISACLPEPDAMTLEQIRNSVPELIDQIADALESAQARDDESLTHSHLRPCTAKMRLLIRK